MRGTAVVFGVNGNSPADSHRDASDALTSTLTSTFPTGTATGTATLASSITDPLHWFGFGTSDFTATMQDGSLLYRSSATFRVAFETTELLAFAFAGEFTANNGSSPPGNAALWQAALAARSGQTDGDQGTGPHATTIRGTIAPGEYVLEVVALTGGFLQGAATHSAHSAFDFNFDLTPIGASPTPEPASMLLLGTGVVGLIVRRRRIVNP